MFGTFSLWDKMIYSTTELSMLEQLEISLREQLDNEDIDYKYEQETVYYLTGIYPGSLMSQLFESSKVIDQSDDHLGNQA